jgi:hypothetical protein
VVDAPIEQIMEVREQLLDALAELPEHEEIARLDANYGMQRELILTLLQGEDSGEYDEDSVDTSIVQAVDDGATNQLAIFDMELEVEIGDDDEGMADNAEMSASGQYASFSQGNGEILAGLLEHEYERVEDGVADIATAAGIPESDVYGAIRGEVAFEPSVNLAIANVFESLRSNPQAYQEFVQLGTQAYNEIIQQAQPQAAQYSAPTVDHELRAEFAAQQEEKAIAQSLKELEYRANAAYDAGYITPTEHYQLVGGLIEDKADRVAAFSAFCGEQQVDPWVQIYANNHTLNFLEQRGPVLDFSEKSDSVPLANIHPEDLNFAQDFVSRNGYE